MPADWPDIPPPISQMLTQEEMSPALPGQLVLGVTAERVETAARQEEAVILGMAATAARGPAARVQNHALPGLGIGQLDEPGVRQLYLARVRYSDRDDVMFFICNR